MYSEIPEPFLFNPLKHHTGYINDFINYCRAERLKREAFKEKILRIGKCMIDIYYGELGVQEIIQNLEAKLKSEGRFYHDDYLNYLSQSRKKYQLIKLCDHSTWTLLIGSERNCWIHIHPARGSVKTIRASALALKTAITLKTWYADDLSKVRLVDLTNDARKEFLDESPIKNMSYTRSLQRVLAFL